MTEHAKQLPVITGVFKNHDSAKHGFEAARSRGYAHDEIDVLMFDLRSKHLGIAGGTRTRSGKAAESAGVGAAVGGTVGAIAALFASIGSSVAVPGLGLFIAGPVATALAGAGAGGSLGTLVGAFVWWTLPSEHAKKYESNLRDGGILLGVRPRSADDARHLSTAWGLPFADNPSARSSG